MTAYAATANSTSLSLAFTKFGPSRRYHPERKAKHRSIHVDPISPPSTKVCLNTSQTPLGGGAGYRPRVRNTYLMRRLSP